MHIDFWIGIFCLITIAAHVAFYYLVVRPHSPKCDSTKGGYIPPSPVLPPPPLWSIGPDADALSKKIDRVIQLLEAQQRDRFLKKNDRSK